jgi:hypothetical protein
MVLFLNQRDLVVTDILREIARERAEIFGPQRSGSCENI